MAYGCYNSLSHVVRVGGLLAVNSLYGVNAALAFYKRSLKCLANGLCIYRGRHDNYFEIGPDDLLCLTYKCKCKVGIYVAFVKFVKYDDAYAIECGVINQHTCENAFGEDFNTSLR